MTKIQKYLLKAFIAFIISVILITLIAVSSYFLNFALSPLSPEQTPDSPYFLQAEFDYQKHYSFMTEEELLATKENYQWMKDKSQTVTISSHDGLKLRGYFLKQNKNVHNYIILMHGYHSSTQSVVDYGKHLYQQGYNVIIPGQRGHGWSEGSYTDMGILAKYDIVAWLIYLNKQDPQAKIGLYGVSMGAATVLLATGLDLPYSVICAVEDCGYKSVTSQFRSVLHNQYHMPAFPIINIASLMCKLKYGFWLGDGNAKKAVKNSTTPTLFIHGTEDKFVPFKMSKALYKSAACPSEYLPVEGAVHSQSMYTDTELYWSTVDNFLSLYFE